MNTKVAEVRERIVLPAGKDKMEVVTNDDCEFVSEGGKFYVRRKKVVFPETYEECCEVLDIESEWHLTFELNNSASCDLCINKEFEYICKLEAFRKLLICRDAYWKIAGDWRPYYTNGEQVKYAIVTDSFDIEKIIVYHCNRVLVFPTEEMRDVFYNNFRSLVEGVKDLL